jgi:hypothetical protein
MTTDFQPQEANQQRKESRGEWRAPRELESDAEGPGLREWFYLLPGKGGAMPPLSTLASAPCWSPWRRRLWDCPQLRGHGYELVTNPPIWARGPRHVW